MRTADVIDGLLEATLVPSFSRIGPALRSRLDHWRYPVDGALAGRVVVVTGATSGLGLAAATSLASAGATVEILGRDEARLGMARDSIRSVAPTVGVEGEIADLGDFDAVRAAADRLRGRHDRIDALVHNAGALHASYATSTSGLERTVASQVVGPFLLSCLLFDQLRAAHPGRIIWVSSGGMYTQPLEVDALEMGPTGYRGSVAYARAKRAQVTLAELMAGCVDPHDVVVHAMHPGWALTPGVEQAMPRFRTLMGPLLRTAEQGADTIVWLAADDGAPRLSTGGFWLDRRTRSRHRTSRTRRADTAAERDRLWELVVARAGVDFPPAPVAGS